jgi:hypothetical protein
VRQLQLGELGAVERSRDANTSRGVTHDREGLPTDVSINCECWRASVRARFWVSAINHHVRAARASGAACIRGKPGRRPDSSTELFGVTCQGE